MALVTPAEIAAEIPGLAPQQLARLEGLAEDASAEVEDWCRRTFALETATKAVSAYGGYQLVLRAPIVSIDSIVDAGGEEIEWEIQDEEAGLVSLLGPAEGRVTVTWTSGFAAIPRPVRRAVIDTVALMLAQAPLSGANAGIKVRDLGDRKLEFFAPGEAETSIPSKARERLAPYRLHALEGGS